jgi:hypothetical protein
VSTAIDIVARALAYNERRAVPIRETSSLGPDPEPTFGIVLLKVVSEEQVQALSFGEMPGPPTIITRWNPLSRESGDLEPFAETLNTYITSMTAAGELPRFWLPNAATLTLVDLLAHRYRTNRNATETLRRMGWQCRVLSEEVRYRGQQVVVVAGDLLVGHVVTGQAPLKDRHLGALLAWVRPPSGVDPAVEADRRALVPAAAMLRRDEDDRIELLRKRAKRGDLAARSEIERILGTAAQREWDLLLEARAAFWELGLTPAPGLERLRRESLTRLMRPQDRGPAAEVHALSELLDEYEYALAVTEDVDVRGDERVRERARRAGRAIAFEVLDVIQPRRGRFPCSLVLRTSQEVLRIRLNTQLSLLPGGVDGRVTEIRGEDGRFPGSIIRLQVTRGVRSIPGRGARVDWVDSVPFDGRFLKSAVYRTLAATRPPLAYAEGLPPAVPRRVPARDLGRVAARLRRR